MPPVRTNIDAAKLLAEAGWVRRLALRVVRDHDAAEDVVQETWLAALRSPEPEEGRLRPWLARVVLNFARRSRRAARRREAHEQRALRPDPPPTASNALEKLEAQRLLVDAITSLDEPFRTTVVLRHVDGLSAAEIARQQGVPAGTVRWRLKKGLDELRARLDARSGGDRSAWAVALVPLLHRPPLHTVAASGVTSAALTGGIAMNALTKTGLAAALLVTASIGVWLAVDARAPGDAQAVAPAAVEHTSELAAQGAAANARPELNVPQSAAERESAALAPARADERVAAPEQLYALDARFVDDAGRGVAGVRVSATSLPQLEFAPSDDTGHFTARFDVQGAPAIDVNAARAGFATWFGGANLTRGETTYLGDVVLAPGGAVVGRVLDAAGVPVVGATVRVTPGEVALGGLESRVRGPRELEPSPHGASDTRGDFRVDGVRAGLVRVWANADTTCWAASEPIDVPARGVSTLVELRLEPLEREDTITGIVLTPDGEPCPHADVRYRGATANRQWSGNFSAGKDGRFVHRIGTRGTHGFTAHDDRGRWPDASVSDVEPGTRDIVLRFPEPRWLELTVRARGGGVIEEYATALVSADGARVLAQHDAESHAAGRVRLLVPNESFLVRVRARGHGAADVGPWTPRDAPASAGCTLDRKAGVRGRVLALGEPVANARVALHEVGGEHTRIENNGFLTRLHPEPDDQTTTDGQGWFELDPDGVELESSRRFFARARGARATFAIVVEAAGWARAETAPVELDPAAGSDGHDVQLVRGGTLTGRVRTAPGRDPAGTVVAIDRGDARPRTLRVGPEGTFTFEHLTPGPWYVVRVDEELRAGTWSSSWSEGEDARPEIPSNCTVVDGQSTRFDIDISDDRPCELALRLVVHGADAAGWSAQLSLHSNTTESARAGGLVDAHGALSIEVPVEGEYDLVLEPPASATCTAQFMALVELRRGRNERTLELSAGSVRGRLADPSAASARITYAAATSGLRFHAAVEPAADGSFTIPVVLAGQGRLTRAGANSETGADVDVPTGAVVDVSVP